MAKNPQTWQLRIAKADLAHQVAESAGVTRLAALDMIACLFAVMREQLIQGHRIEARGFGVLETRHAKAKPAARNPRTGELVYVPARRKTHFRPGRALKEALCEVPTSES